MAGYNEIISRGSPTDPLIPDTITNQLIMEDLPKASVLLTRARRIPLSNKSARQPVLSALPQAYWLNGDTGLKQTTKAQWENVIITAEELAAIVVIPDAYFDDASIPLWDSIRPLLAEAIANKVDQAGLFGVDKPGSWPAAVVPGAVAAGNVVAAGTGADLAQDVAMLGQLVAEDGYAVNGFATAPGFRWRLIGLRGQDGQPIYAPPAGDQPATLYGFPLNEVMNGAWETDDADLIAADWAKMVVGVRQDMQFRIFDQGVISDEEGKVVVNLMQQDAKAMRVTFRVGFQVAKSLNRVNPNSATRYPAGVLTPAVTSS